MSTTDAPSVALVTGAANGIGLATAQSLLEAGYAVVLIDIDSQRGEAARETLSGLGETAFLRCDVADESQVNRAVEQTIDRWGRVDALVNNAGICCTKPMTGLSLAEWNRVLAVNLTATFLFTRACAAPLTQHRGAVVNIASIRALQSEPHTEAYSASKGGLIALTHAMAISLGPAVRVNCISPGWINTTETVFEANLHEQHPAGRIGTPRDIARLAVYLLSDAAEFITGANHVVDGGMTQKMIYL